MDNWEALVHDYICLDRRILVNSQYDIGGKTWKANADFLAVDFFHRIVWMVEVSTSGQKFADKVAYFEKEYRPRIIHQLREARIISDFGEWGFGIWLFPKKSFEEKSLEILKNSNLKHTEVTTLEHVATSMLNGDASKETNDKLTEISLVEP